MMLFIIDLEFLEDGDCMRNVCVFDHDLLESSVKGSVLFNDLPELVKSRGSDALDVSACQSRLEHVCCIKTS